MMDSSLRVSVFVLAGSDAMLMSSDIGGHAVLLKLQDKNGCMEFDFFPPLQHRQGGLSSPLGMERSVCGLSRALRCQLFRQWGGVY